MNRRKFLQISICSALLISAGAYSLKKIFPYIKLRKLSKAIEISGKVNKKSEQYLYMTKSFTAANFNLNGEITKDFKLGNVLNINGWCLSVTECYYIVYTFSD